MLRWCQSTVRELGGYGGILQDIRSLSTYSAPKSNATRRKGRVCPVYDTHDNASSLSGVVHTRTDPYGVTLSDARIPTVIGQEEVLRRPLPLLRSPRTNLEDQIDMGNAANTNHACSPQWREPTPINPQEYLTRTGSTIEVQTLRVFPEKPHDNSKAIDLLYAFLSPNNMTSCHPEKHSANTLRSLYMSAKARNQLGQLDSGRLSSLISLFGSLSLHPFRHCIYTNPFASHFKEHTISRSYWSFVVLITKDKERLGQTLSHSDRYWIMRAELANVVRYLAVEFSESKVANLSSAIYRARIQYRHICQHTADPEVHVPYFEALLSIEGPGFLDAAVYRLCSALQRHDEWHPRLLGVLWRILLQFNGNMSTISRELVLSTFWHRVSNLSLRGERAISTKFYTTQGSPPGSYPHDAFSVNEIARSIVTVLASSTSSSDHIAQYATTLLRSIFVPANSLGRRWSSIMLLALYNGRPALISQATMQQETMPIPCLATVTWEAVFSLATMRKVLGGMDLTSVDQSTLKDMIQGTLRTSWENWSACAQREAEHPLAARSIVSSFFYLSGVIGDMSLKDACHAYSNSSKLWCDDDDGLTRLQILSMAAEFLIASLPSHVDQCRMAFTDLKDTLPDTRWLPAITSIAIDDLVRRDPRLAYALYVAARRDGIEIAVELIISLGVALAKVGAYQDAIPFLHNCQLSVEQKQELLSHVLRHMAQYQSANFEPDSLSTLGDALRDTYSSSLPPRTVRWCLEYILILILESVHAGKALSIIKAITQTSPSYFESPFFLRCSRVFLRHKQYRYAVQLLELVGRLYPQYSTMFRSVVHELMRSGATSLVRRACLAVPGSLGKHGYQFTARAVAIRSHMPIRILSLKASSELDRGPPDISGIRLAMHLSIRAGRILAAKKLFARVANKLDADTRTSLCNLYLHGVVIQPLPRNGRKMRKVLASLNYLVDQHSFTPDRVTVNILLKAVMRWRTMFDNKKLRALFDHMIRSGYPAREHVSSGRLPFGTPLSRAPQEMQLPKLPPYISFERHARPLYMMFIKAFYFRNDVQAARTVIDILKGEKHAVAMRNMEQGPPHDVTDDVHS